MPTPRYDIKCKACGLPAGEVFWSEYVTWDYVFTLDDPCPCGSVDFVKDGVGLTADMSNQWERRCQRVHGVKDAGTPKPNPATRRKQADAKSVATAKPRV